MREDFFFHPKVDFWEAVEWKGGSGSESGGPGAFATSGQIHFLPAAAQRHGERGQERKTLFKIRSPGNGGGGGAVTKGSTTTTVVGGGKGQRAGENLT